MAKKYYAIKNTKQVVTSWEECKEIVNGMSGAQYKAFKTEAEAQAFIDGTDKPLEQKVIDLKPVAYTSAQGISGTITIAEDTDPMNLPFSGKRYAVDGSFNSETNTYGSGIIHLDENGKVIQTNSVAGSRPEFATARNVAGEVVAFATAIAKAVEKGETEITIICDYEGDFRWAAPKTVIVNGQACWGNKRGTPIADYHHKAMEYASQNGIKTIDFIWVRGHKGVEVNEMADKIAKKAAGVN